MTHNSAIALPYKLVATARAVLVSPENVVPLPLVQLAMNEVKASEARNGLS